MTRSRKLAAILVVTALLPGTLASSSPRRLRLWTVDFYSTHTGVSVEVEPNGVARFSTAGPTVEAKRTLGPEEMARLTRLVEEVGFFDLASAYGTCYHHDIVREIRVELDARKKRVGLCSISGESVPEARRQGAVGAWRVWNAARMLFPEHYP